MISNDLFQCKPGDKIVYLKSFILGVIVEIIPEVKITFNWVFPDNSDYETQYITFGSYTKHDSWRTVYKYDTEQELFALKLTHGDHIG